jgi:hypothetical protein
MHGCKSHPHSTVAAAEGQEKVQNVELEHVVALVEEIARQRHQDGAGVATATPATVEPGLRMDGESTSRGYQIWLQQRRSWPLRGDQCGDDELSRVVGAAVLHNFH